ncbi:hypothetical protein N234_24810 [Ralstonia pickettii DTP0602]|nr:hypothetical protein N234_24810 [Ralstonia pickettii DTP0602]
MACATWSPRPASRAGAAGLRRRAISPANAPPLAKETNVLSPHELATLLLLSDGPDSLDSSDSRQIDPVDLKALVEKQLVQLEVLHGCRQEPRITSHGYSMLKAMGR